MENYEYIADLGSGSYGFVWKCTQRSSGRTVAVKGFKLAHTDKRFLDQAIREVRMLRAACDHPNVVQLLEAFRSSSGRVYLVFEFVERCLSAELHKRFTCGLPAAQTRLVLWQLLAAVAHMHAKKIIHRDIKPGNLLLTAQGLLKLCDFGFARTTRGEPYQADRFSSYVVTRWYRSPEMLVSDQYCGASDIWSLGCTFAELATGRPLFPGTSSLDQLWRIMRCLGPLPPSQAERFAAAAAAAGLPEPPPPPPRGKSLWQRLPELDSRLLEVVQACLRLDPAKRPTAVQLMQMPYFWEVPKLIAASPLERVYAEYGGAGAFCQQTATGRLRSYLSRSGMSGAASLSATSLAVQRSGTATEDASVLPPGQANGTSAAAADGGGGEARRQPSGQPSMLLSTVAASLLGEHGSTGGGSMPLVSPLPPPPAPTAAAHAHVQPHLPLSHSQPQLARTAGASENGTADDGSGGSRAHSGTAAAAAGRILSPRAAAAAAVVSNTAMQLSPSPAPPPGIPRARSHSRFLAVASQHHPHPHPYPHPPNPQQQPSPPHSPSSLPPQRQPPQQHVPQLPHPSQQLQRRVTANVTTSAAAAAAAAVAQSVQSFNRTQSAREPADPAEAAAEARPQPPPPPPAATHRTVAFGDATQPRTPLSAEPDDAAIAAGLLSDGDGGGGGGGGLGPGAGAPAAAGLLSDGAGEDVSDCEGHISDDDELMQYFAARAPGEAGHSRRAATTPSALLGSAADIAEQQRHGPAAAVAGVSATAAAVAARISGLGSTCGNAPSPLGGRRTPSEVVRNPAVQVAHRSLYGTRHGSGTGLAAMLPSTRRVAAMVLGTTDNGVSGGSVGGMGPSAAVSASPSSPTYRMRATVGSYLATADSLSAVATPSLSGAPLAGPAAPSARASTTSAAGACNPRCMDPHATHTGLPALTHHSTTTGMTTPTTSSLSLGMPTARTSLPVHSCHAMGCGPTTTGYCMVGGGSAACGGAAGRRAVSRQGSMVFNQLMYDALPEIGTPGGAPEVPTATPPRRRAVMSGFTPCRTAVARAAAEGVPPAAAMAAAMGEVLRATPADLNVAYSPIRVSRPGELLSPEDGLRDGTAHFPDHGRIPITASASSAAISAAAAAAARRMPYPSYHRRQVLSLPQTADAGGGVGYSQSVTGCAGQPGGPGGPGGGGGLSQPYRGPTAGGMSGVGGANSPHSYSQGAPAYNYGYPGYPHAGGPAATTSDTGMLLGSSAPSYYRQQARAEAAAAAAAEGLMSPSGAVPIPSGNYACHMVSGGCGGGGGATGGGSGGAMAYGPGSVSSRGYPHPLTPAGRSRLASGNMGRLSDLSVSNPREVLQQYGAAVDEDAPSVDLDALGPWGGGVVMSPGVPGILSGGGTPPSQLPAHPQHHAQPCHHYNGSSNTGACMQTQQHPHPQQCQQGQAVATGARGGRVGRWVSALIDSLPEDREVVLAAADGWRNSPASGVGVGVGGGSGSRIAVNDGPIQELTLYSSEFGGAGGGCSGGGQQPMAPPDRSNGVTTTSLAGHMVWATATDPRSPCAGGSGSGAADAGSGRATSPHQPDGSPPGTRSGRSKRDAEAAAAAAASASSVTLPGGCYPISPPSLRPASSAAPATGAAGAAAEGGGGSRRSKWPKAKALLGGRLLSSLVRKFKDQTSADK